VRVADEIPAVRKFAGAADIVNRIVAKPGLAGLQRDNGVELPTLQELCRRFLSWKLVRYGKSEAVPYIEVAAGILAARMRAVLRNVLADIDGIVVQRVRVRVGYCAAKAPGAAVPLPEMGVPWLISRMPFNLEPWLPT
jgi:hypothetical protein